MTIYVDRVKRMRGYKEPNGSFAAQGALGSFFEIPFVEGTCTVTRDRPTESPGHSQQHLDGHPLEVLMPKRATMTFDVPLETFSTKATSTVAATHGHVGALLEIIMGAKSLGTGTTVNDASPATILNTLTTVTNILAGQAIGYATGTGGALEVRTIADKTGSDISVKHALTAAPSNGGTAYSSATYYMSGTDGSQTLSLQIAYEGLFSSDRYVLLGGWLSSPPKLALGVGGRPILTTTWTFANWLQDADATADLSGALAAATYTNTVALVHKDSEFRSQVVGTTTIGTLLQASEISFEPNIVYGVQTSSAGTNNVVQPIRLRSNPVIKCSFTLPFEDLTWFTARDNRTKHDLTLQIGSAVATGAIYIELSNGQVTDVQLVEAEGITAQRVTVVGGLDTAAGTTNDLQQSAFRIHLL